LSLSRDGDLLQSPAPELAKLRGSPVQWRNVQLDNSEKTFALPKTNTLEISVEVDMASAKNLQLQISDGQSPPVAISFNGSELQVLDTPAPLRPKLGGSKLRLRIFTDRSVLEVFANDTVCITKVIPPFASSANLAIHATGGDAKLKRLQAWPMQSIW